MKSVYNFVVKPKGERYNNTKKLDNGELILNTEIYNHQYVNREAIVISTPIIGDTDIKPGDTVILHHKYRILFETHLEEVLAHLLNQLFYVAFRAFEFL